jgi:hypothetical protein
LESFQITELICKRGRPRSVRLAPLGEKVIRACSCHVEASREIAEGLERFFYDAEVEGGR